MKIYAYSKESLIKKSELSDYLPYISISETDAWHLFNLGKPVNILYKTETGFEVVKCKITVDWDDWTLSGYGIFKNAKDGDTVKVYTHSKFTSIFVCTDKPERGKAYFLAGSHTSEAVKYIANMYGIENFLRKKGYKYYKVNI